MSSGVETDPKVKEELKSIQDHDGSNAAIICRINPQMTLIEIEKVFTREEIKAPVDAEGYAKLLESIPEDEPRYILIDLEYDAKFGDNASKMIAIAWIPDSSKIKMKMIYSTSFRGFLDFIGLDTKVNCTDPDELTYEEIGKKIGSNTVGY